MKSKSIEYNYDKKTPFHFRARKFFTGGVWYEFVRDGSSTPINHPEDVEITARPEAPE